MVGHVRGRATGCGGIGGAALQAEVGGWEIQTGSGAVDHAVDNEEAALEAGRRFLSYLPSSVSELPARSVPNDDPARVDEASLLAIPRDIGCPYRVRPVVESLCDRDSVLEVGRWFERSVFTGLARLDGCWWR